MSLNKCAREVIDEFRRSGIEVEIVQKRRHYLVFHGGNLVYKFGQGTKKPSWAMNALSATINRLKSERAP